MSNVLGSTSKVLKGQFAVQDNTPVHLNASGWMSLVGGLVSIGSAALGVPAPQAAAALGVLSGGLSVGAAATSPWGTGDHNPPSYENTFDTTIGDLAKYATDRAQGFLTGYDQAQESIYVDSAKLLAVGAKAGDSDSGWSLTDLQEDKMSEALSAGILRMLYLQLVPQFYSLDTYPAQPVRDVTQIGTFYQTYDVLYFTTTCTSSHPSPNEYGYMTNVAPGWPPGQNSSPYDIFVIAGNIHNQGTKDVSEDLPSDSLLETLFAPAPNGLDSSYLNFPRDMFYSTNKADGGLLQYRPGPDQGYTNEHGLCYKPGCSAKNPGDDAGFTECRGPGN